MAEEIVTLKVGELTNREEFGRGIVRLDNKTMQKIGIKEGDIVELQGREKTGAIAVRAYPADFGLNVIRMDGITRRNAGVGVGETIKIKKVEAKEAKRVVLAPTQKGIRIQADAEGVKRNLFMRPVSQKDILAPYSVVRRRRSAFGDMPGIEDIFSEFFGSAGGFSPIAGDIKLMVVSTVPSGIVKITDATDIEIKPEAVDTETRTMPSITYEDIGGLGDAVQKVRETVELPLRHPELFEKLGIDPPKGVLLYGPPGTGKTLIAKAVANESEASFHHVSGPEFLSKFYGESESNLRKIFEEAEKSAPSIIFIDEIDAIAPKREEVTGEVERRIVSQLLTLLDGMKSRGKVIVIGATNRQNALDPALRRPGRLDREIEIGVPDQKGRKEVLQIHTRNMPLEKDVDIDMISGKTYGYVGADLEALAKEAAMAALRRNLPGISWKKDEQIPAEIIEKLTVGAKDFEEAFKMVEPSGMREVMIEIPNVKWEDIGGLDETKETLKEIIEWPLKSPKSFETIGIKPPTGVLFYGPPGCGKTMIAKAVANEAGANFISIRGPEITSKWVGESEKHIREIFKRAKQVAPTIIFFDEIDSIATSRGTDSGSRAYENIVSQILVEMSGIEELRNVIVIAATNRPDIIDSALLRSGRLERQLLIPAPDQKSREMILQIHTRNMPVEKDINIKKLAEKTEGYTGADLEALIREAGMGAVRKIKGLEDKRNNEIVKIQKISDRKARNDELKRYVGNLYEKMIPKERDKGKVLKRTVELLEKYENTKGEEIQSIIQNVVRELDEFIEKEKIERVKTSENNVTKKDFDAALTKIRPSLNAKVMEFYSKVDEILRVPIKKEKEKEVEYVG